MVRILLLIVYVSLSWLRCIHHEHRHYHHYDDVIMTMLASQITSLTVVYSIVYLGVNQRKHQSSASLAFVWEIHRGPVNFPHKWPVTRKMFPFDDVIMIFFYLYRNCHHPHSEWWIWHLQWCCPFSSPKIKGVVYTCDAMACKHFQHNRPFVRRIQRSSLDPPHVKWRYVYQSVGNTRAAITQLLALEKGKRRPWQLFHGTA